MAKSKSKSKYKRNLGFRHTGQVGTLLTSQLSTLGREIRGREAVTDLLEAMGMDPEEEGMKDTPKRVFKALMEFRQPINLDKIFTHFAHTGGDKNGFSGMVVQTGIPFRQLCEHHLMPAIGVAHLGYIPNRRVLGLSKLTRLVDAVCVERPSLQEYICDRIVNLMEEHLEPKGTMCIITAEHGCMACRGVNRPNVATTTSSLRGVFVHVPHARTEFLELVKMRAR